MSNEDRLRALSHPARLGRWMAGLLAIGLVLGGCSTGGAAGSGRAGPSEAGPYRGRPGSGTVVGNATFVPILVSAEVGVGHSRVLFTVQDDKGLTLASPDLSLDLRFYDLQASVEKVASTAKATFRWLIPDSRGIYVAYADFGSAGDWGVEATGRQAGQPDRVARVTFSVREKTSTPAIGANAPPSDTPTANDRAALAAISTDAHPNLGFYAVSIRGALAAGKPFVVVFATPAFCESRTCGPALDLVKQVAPDYAGRVNFIHVEPYRLQVAGGRIQPVLSATGQLEPIRAVVQWGLPTEPYVFVVEGHGKVAAKFEGPAYPDELKSALDKLLG